MERRGTPWPVPPDYLGGSLVNLVATIAGLFGLETGHPPLKAPLPESGGVERIALVLCDALGDMELDRHIRGGDMPFVTRLLAEGVMSRRALTSVFPSTTAAALTSLHTGLAPAEHGCLGYSLWLAPGEGPTDMLKAEDVIRHSPRPIPPGPPSIYARLSARGVTCRCVNAAAFADSALSRRLFAGAEYRPWYSANTLPSLVADALDVPGPVYVHAYWPDHDTLCHVYGPDGGPVADEAAAFDAMLERLVGRVRDALPRGRTLILITADHGQVALDPDAAVVLDALLPTPPAGERCALYLRDRPGLAEALRPHGTVRRMEDIWREGWFGGPPSDPDFVGRVGDLLVVASGGRQFIWRGPAGGERGRPWRGGHGGWSADEMLVPLLAIRV